LKGLNFGEEQEKPRRNLCRKQKKKGEKKKAERRIHSVEQ